MHWFLISFLFISSSTKYRSARIPKQSMLTWNSPWNKSIYKRDNSSVPVILLASRNPFCAGFLRSWVNQLFLWVYIKPCWDWPFRDLSRSIIRLAPSHGWIIATKGKNIGDFKPLSSEKWSQTDVFRMLRHVETLIITVNPIISPWNAHFMLFIPLYSSSIPFKSY